MRWTFAAFAWVALAGAAVFVIQSEKQINARHVSARAFSTHARDAIDALHDLRASQQAYVAAGQGIAFWMPKVTATIGAARDAIASTRESAETAAARSALDAAADALTEFNTVDGRAREYLKSDQQLMAADVVFTDGGEAALKAARQIAAAATAEDQAEDAATAAARKAEAAAGTGAAAVCALGLLLLARSPRSAEPAGLSIAEAQPVRPAETVAAAPARDARAISPVLRTAAALCTDFGRVRDAGDLNDLLARAADVMDASGLVVWIGGGTGTPDDRLRPILAHGYAPQVLAKMPSVPRSANNAAAAAYRTGALQIVLTRPGAANGAIVAPLLGAEGSVGALSVEVRGGGEGSDSVQALAAIFAAQLAPIVAASIAPLESTLDTARVANQ